MTAPRAAVNAFLFWSERRSLAEIGYTGLNSAELKELRHVAEVHGCTAVELASAVQALALDEWYLKNQPWKLATG